MSSLVSSQLSRIAPLAVALVVALSVGCAGGNVGDNSDGTAQALAAGGTQTFTGSVNAAGTKWLAYTVKADVAGPMTVKLSWTSTSADLNLFILDLGTNTNPVNADHTQKPETATFNAKAGTTYRLGVQAQTGSSSFTLTASLAGSACVAHFPGDPGCSGKLYYGAAVEGGNPATLEAKAGGKIGVYRSYFQTDDAASKFATRANDDVSNGRIPLISTKLPGSWADVAAGKYDAWLVDRIKALAAVPGPVWLCLHHEPTSDGPPADWVKMQQHARTLIKANSTNIALVGILNGWDFIKNNATPEVWYHAPGTGVDVMGFDSYNAWSPTNGKPWKSAADTFAPAITIESWGYPTLVGEYGVRTDPTSPGKAAQWMRDAYTFAYEHNFVAISYFDSGQNSPDGTWVMDAERQAVFNTNLAAAHSTHF